MVRLSRSKDVINHLRVGVNGVLQFSEKYKLVKIRQPATILGWKSNERILLDAGTPTYHNSARLHEFLQERCIYRYIDNNCALAIEARLLDVSVQMGRRGIWIGWPNFIHVYPYRTQGRTEVELPCNVQLIGTNGAGPVLHGHILDISLLGCCIGIPTNSGPLLPTDKNLLLSFQIGALSSPCGVEGRIRHKRDYGSEHLYGIEFGAMPEELTEELRNLFAEATHFSHELEALRQRHTVLHTNE